MNRHLPWGVAALALSAVILVVPSAAAPSAFDLILTPPPSNPPSDIQPPEILLVGESLRAAERGGTVLLFAKVRDNVGISEATLRTDETGDPRNWTDRYGSPFLFPIKVGPAWVVFPWRNPEIPSGKTIQWQIWLRDMNGNEVATEPRSFTITDPIQPPTPSTPISGRNPTGHNSTLEVCATCPFTTISSAVAAASPEDTIFVFNGTYTEQVVISTSQLTVIGESPSNTTIDGGGGPVAVSITGAQTRFSNFTVRNADQVLFLNFIDGNVSNVTVESSGGQGRFGVVFFGFNVTIENMTINGPTMGLGAVSDVGLLSGAINNVIKNSTIRGFNTGISISGDTLLTNSTVLGSRFGIAAIGHSAKIIGNSLDDIEAFGILVAGFNYTISDNQVVNTSVHSISLDHSNGNILRNNTIISSRVLGGSTGISLFRSEDNILTFNNVSNASSNLIIRGLFNNSIDTTNMVEGKPVFYVLDVANAVFDETTNAGFFGCIRCNNVTISNLNLSTRNFDGLLLVDTKDSTIVNVSASLNSNGVSLISSRNNTIMGSNFTSNGEHEIILESSSDQNTLTGNKIGPPVVPAPSFSGIRVFRSNNTLVKDNSINMSGISFGVLLHVSQDNIAVNNTISNSTNGISIQTFLTPDTGINNSVVGNTIQGNGLGIHTTGSSSRHNFSNNRFFSNAVGISLFDSDTQMLNNSLTSNNVGISISSANNTIRGNNASFNSQGITIRHTGNNTVTNNIVTQNQFRGIEIVEQETPLANRIENNTIARNVPVGVFISGFNGTILTANNISENGDGVVLMNSQNTTIVANNVSFNTQDGIRLDGADNNQLSNNILRSNTRYGIYINRSDNVASTGDDARFNLHGIFYNQTVNNTVRNGVFNSNTEDGVRIENTDTSLVEFNTIKFNNRGSHVITSTNFDVFTNDYNNIVCDICIDPSHIFLVLLNILLNGGLEIIDSSDGKTILNVIRFADFGLRLINASDITLEDDRITESQKSDFFLVDSDASADNVTFDSGKVVVAGLFGLTALRDLNVVVTDSGGSPVQGATVTIFNVSSGLVFNGSTNSTGRIPTQTLVQFREDDLRRRPETPYTVTVSAPGFQTTATSTDLNESTTVAVPLAPEVPFPFGCFQSTPGLRAASLRIQNRTFPVNIPVHGGVQSHPANACENEFRSGAFQFNRTEFIDNFSRSGLCLVTDIYTNRQGNVERLVPLRPCLPPVPPPPPPLMNLPTAVSFQNNKTQDGSKRLTLNTSEEAVLEATFNQTGTFTWKVDGVVEKTEAGVGQSIFSVSFNDSDIHVVTLTVSNANGTSDKLQWIFNVVPLPPPPPPPPPPPTILFSDNFSLDANNDGIPDGWIPLAGTWQLVNGQLCSSGNTQIAAIYYGASAFSGDLAASVDIQLITGFGGLFERLVNPSLFPSDLYGAVYAPASFFGSDFLALIEFDGFQQLTFLPIPSGLLPVQRIGGGVRGANLEGTVNGVLVGSAPLFFSPKLNTGFAGLVAIQGDVCFDNFEIKSA